ncbi:MAG: hypothetical protein IT374_07780 [Polyangiaceae bacterium]|nr:hypothetical protein [Polyangiaceae bacterium]
MRWLCLAVALTAPVIPGCKCAKDGAAASAAPSSSAPPQAAASASPADPRAVLDELTQHAATLRVTLKVAPQVNGRLDPKISLYELHLGAGAKPKTSGRIGPSMKPIADSAELSQAEAKALLEWLGRPGSLDGVTRADGPSVSQRHASVVLGWTEDPSRYVVVLPWAPASAQKLDAIRALLSAEHRPLVETLTAPLPR